MSRSIAIAFTSCALAACVAACAASQTPPNDPTGALSSASSPVAPELPPPASASVPVAPVDTAPTPVSSGTSARPTGDTEMAPLVLKLTGPSTPPGKGDIKLALEIVVNTKISGPVALAVKLPAGATLKSGQATESLQLPQAQTLNREYVVATKAALSEPIVVTADYTSAGGGSGFHAERQYPEKVEPTAASSAMKPPIARPSSPPPGKRR